MYKNTIGGKANFHITKTEMKPMISKMAWNAFMKTGDINTFLEFIETKNIEENMIEEQNGDNKDQRIYIERK